MGIQAPSNLPPGCVTDYAGATAPSGWLFMNGSAVSRTVYAGLFAAIGTVFGAGDGSTTFNLPDARGRATLGVDNMGGTAANRLTTGGSGVNGVALGAVGGGENVTLITAQLASHNHTDSGHNHTQNPHTHQQTKGSVSGSAGASGFDATPAGGTLSTQSATPTNNAASAVISSNGSNSAHANIPPALVLNKIIKT